MVKAPRSKGCRVCVQRRVKCDREQPTCLRCRKAGRQCPGYQTMSFVDEGPSIREQYKIAENEKEVVDRSSLSSSATSSASRHVNSPPFEYFNQTVPGESDVSTAVRTTCKGECRDLERSFLVSVLSPTAHQSQLYSLFLATVQAENPVHIGPTYSCHSNWLTQVANRTEVSPTLLYAIRALSLSFLGRQVRDEHLVQNSRLIYGRSLLKLNKSLQDLTEGYSSDTLSATVLLTFYEMLNCTEQDSWIRHAGGTAHLMKIRGAARHRTGFGRAIYLASRYSLITQSFQTGKPCFLSSAPWRKLSQEIHDSCPQKSAFEDAREAFFQEIVDHPGYVMDSVNYMASGGRDQLVLRNLVWRGRMHRSNHKAIFNRCIATLREAGQEPIEVPSATNDRVFPMVYQFPGILAASFYCCHWSLLKLLNITLIGLEAKLSAVESASQGLQSPFTPAQMLAACNMPLSRENLTRVIVAECTTSRKVDDTHLAGNPQVTGIGKAPMTLADRTLYSPAAKGVAGHERSEFPVLAEDSESDYPIMSPGDVVARRQMYMAENRRCAREICKSVEDVSTSAFLGPIFLIFSLRVIARMLESAEEKEWIMRKLEAFGRTWGVATEGLKEMSQTYGGAPGGPGSERG